MKERLLAIVRWIRKFIREKFHSENEELPYYVTILISAILFVVALNGFVEITDELAENELAEIYKSVTEYIIYFRCETLTKYCTFDTNLGACSAYVVIM